MDDAQDASRGASRVLWLIKGLGPGGAEQLLVATARELDLARFAVTVGYLRADKDHLAGPLREAGVPPILLTAGVGTKHWTLALRAQLRSADLVHAHSPLLAAVARLLARTLPRARRPALVSTEHNVWSNYSRPTRLLNALTGHLDAHRWAVSEGVRDSMWPSLRRRTEVLRHGIARTAQTGPDARARLRSELGIPDASVVVITVANLRREKDYPNLVAAARTILRRQDDVYVLAVGQGPLERQIRDEVDTLGAGPRFQLLGYRSDVADLLRASDVFVLASRTEGLPVAIMEAMAAGLPVVATDVGGVAEAVTADLTGRLVPPADPAALAGAVLALTQDPAARRRLGHSGQSRSANFDIAHAVRRMEEVYTRVLTSSTTSVTE